MRNRKDPGGVMYNKKIEAMDRADTLKLQLERLISTVEHCYNNVPLYKKRFLENGIKPSDIKSLSDLSKIPFTVKDDIRETFPYGMFAVPMRDVVRIHASSGTTGQPTVVGYTRNDLEMWSECIARIVTAGGATPEDIAQISFGYGLFTGAFGLHYGLEKLGCAVIPMSSGNTEKQINVMRDFGSTLLIGTPSYALHIAEILEEMGYTKDDIKLKYGIFGAEASTEEMRAEIENRLGIIATENYGMSELVGPGVAGECVYRTGQHINEDYFIVEVINPDTGEVLPDGERGELVITPIMKEAFPLLRYRTRDISRILTDKCECGRTSRRIEKITGRSDDMLIIKGVNVFPSQIEAAIFNIPHISPNYQITVFKKGHFDAIEVTVELIDGALLERFSELEELEKTIQHKIYSVTGLMVKIKLVSPKTIERSMGKAKRVVDLRQKGVPEEVYINKRRRDTQ
jgi:phenylacetate-CoA ligase